MNYAASVMGEQNSRTRCSVPAMGQRVRSTFLSSQEGKLNCLFTSTSTRHLNRTIAGEIWQALVDFGSRQS